MKLTPFQLYLRTMIVGPNKFARLSKEEAYESLKRLTKQDFGWDTDRWREWGKRRSQTSAMKGRHPGRTDATEESPNE